MTKGHPLKGCLFYFPNFAGYCPGSRYLANGKKIRGGTRSQLRRPLFPLGLPLVGHAENMRESRGDDHMKFKVEFV